MHRSQANQMLFFLILADIPYSDNDDDIEKFYESSDDEIRQPKIQKKIKPKIIVPFYKLIRTREVIIILYFVLCFYVYYLGKKSYSAICKEADKFVDYLSNYYAAVPHKFSLYENHSFDQIITGRYTHLVLHVVLELTKRIDIIGYLYDKIMGKKPSLILEFLLDPVDSFCGIIHIAQDKPSIFKPLKITPRPYDQKLVFFSDLEDSVDHIFNQVKEFYDKHPNIIKMIELSSSNRFDMRRDGRYVARFEFSMDQPNEVLSKEVADFSVSIADAFATLHVDKMIQTRNKKLREQLFSE